MTTQKQYYLNCNNCGLLYADGSNPIYGETSQEVKDDASDNGWVVDFDIDEELEDVCPVCKKQLEGEINREQKNT